MNCNQAISSFPDESLNSKLDFILELDKLKHVLRRTLLMDASRRENAAEHSWEIATMALVLHKYGEPGTDLFKSLKMLLIHDLVEIDAGDTYIYDQDAVRNQVEREARAAERIFGLLPEPDRSELHCLWKEFEARETADARFARAIDRLQPLIHNYCTKGQVWKENRITADRVRQTVSVVSEASDSLGRLSNYLVASRFLCKLLFSSFVSFFRLSVALPNLLTRSRSAVGAEAFSLAAGPRRGGFDAVAPQQQEMIQ